MLEMLKKSMYWLGSAKGRSIVGATTKAISWQPSVRIWECIRSLWRRKRRCRLENLWTGYVWCIRHDQFSVLMCWLASIDHWCDSSGALEWDICGRMEAITCEIENLKKTSQNLIQKEEDDDLSLSFVKGSLAILFRLYSSQMIWLFC